MPPVQSLVVVHGWPAKEPPAHTSGSTLPPSSFSSSPSLGPSPQTTGIVVVVTVGGGGQSVPAGCGLQVRTKWSVSTRRALRLPVEMPVSTTTAVLGLFFFFPPSFSWKLLAKAPQEGSPASEDGAGSIFRPFTPITLPIAFFN